MPTQNDSKSDQIAKDVSSFFDGYAEDFSSIYLEDTKKRSPFNKLMDKLYRHDIVDRFQRTVKETQKSEIQTVLDIGCGPGHFVIKFLEQGKKVTALDIAPSMLEITKQRVLSKYPDSDVKYILDDYSAHHFDEQFDAACVMGFFDYVEDPVSVLKKLLKDIKKEIYISIPGNKGFLAFQRKIRYKLRNCPLYLYSESDLKNYLDAAGCLDITEFYQTERGQFIIIRK